MACILLLPFSWLTFWRYLAVADLHGLLLWFSLWDAQIVAVLYTVSAILHSGNSNPNSIKGLLLKDPLRMYRQLQRQMA